MAQAHGHGPGEVDLQTACSDGGVDERAHAESRDVSSESAWPGESEDGLAVVCTGPELAARRGTARRGRPTVTRNPNPAVSNEAGREADDHDLSKNAPIYGEGRSRTRKIVTRSLRGNALLRDAPASRTGCVASSQLPAKGVTHPSGVVTAFARREVRDAGASRSRAF